MALDPLDRKADQFGLVGSDHHHRRGYRLVANGSI